MMNLELLWYTSLLTGNRSWYEMAFAHANRTMHEHVRADGSTWHVVVYDEQTGGVMKKVTSQGYSDNSTWSRGQSWGVYGFTMAYRFTGYAPFLHTAQRLADYFLHHLHLESPDSVPYWDFLAPLSTYQPRDTSAGAIASSGILELSQHLPAPEGQRYVAEAQMILGNLTSSSSPYYVQNLPSVKLPAVLVNVTTGPWHGFSSTAPFNVAEAYGDYYLTEALTRLAAIQRGQPLPNVDQPHPSSPLPQSYLDLPSAASVMVNWSNVTSVLKTVPTLQMVVHPLLTRASPIHDAAFDALAALHPAYARFASWFPFPRLSVPSIDPPSGLHQCGNVGMGYDVRLSCERGGGVIDRVEFASFGLPDGVCGSFTRTPACDAKNSSAAVEALCVGKRNCTVPASAAVFGAPCASPATRLAVQVTCDPPQNNSYWNFEHLDSLVADFMAAAGEGNNPVMGFMTMPSWLFNQSGQPVHHAPDNLVGTDWGYETGTQLVDPTCEQAGQWYGRLASWYINGGMVDEYGHRHASGHHYPMHLWEVLNEELHEHAIDISTYICLYDAIVHAVRRMVGPSHPIEFVGMAYANVDVQMYDSFRAFLNHSNHRPGTPLDWLSYHWYSAPSSRTDPQVFETFFADNQQFVGIVQQIEAIRTQLSPQTRTTIDEVGVMLPGDNDDDAAVIPLVYFNAAGAAFAHLFALLAPLGIDVLGSSQLMGSPLLPDVMGGLEPQFPSVTLLNWTTGTGTARYRVLELLIDEFVVGDALVETAGVGAASAVFAQGWVRRARPAAVRFVLLINTKSVASSVTLTGAKGGSMRVVDEQSGGGPPRSVSVLSDDLILAPFAVAVVHFAANSTAALPALPQVQPQLKPVIVGEE